MFLFALGGSLVLGGSLLAAASFSEGTLVAISTAAQGIGWLFILATVVGVISLRRASFGQLGAATVTFVSGLALLYVSYFQGVPVLDAPIRHAAADVLPPLPVAYKVVDMASVPAVMPVATKEVPPENEPVARKAVAVAAIPAPARDKCDSQLGLAWILCQERVRLEYCQGRESDEATCPSAIPHIHYSPPG